jgi:competence protein ComEC
MRRAPGAYDGRDSSARTTVAPDEPALLTGVLREDAALLPFGASILLDVRCVEAGSSCGAAGGPSPGFTAQRLLGGVRLSIGGASAAGRAQEWRAGRSVRVAAMVRRPTLYVDPGVPDDVRALARRGIVLVGSVKSAALVEVLGRGSLVEEAAAAARAWSRRQLTRHIGRWSAQSGAIAAAILIGDRSGLSDEDERRLQEAGTYHVIAISGGNIAILTAMLLVAMRMVRAPDSVAAAIAIAVLLFYGQLAGGGASVSRAVTAACVYLGGRMLDHRGPALNALAVAAVAGLAVAPLAAFDGGFLLSFGATLGILLGAQRLRPGAPNRGAGSVDPASAAFSGSGGSWTAVDSELSARAVASP